MSRVAFITGITGQDGSYLAEFLLNKDYIIYGLVRRVSLYNNLINIEHIKDKINIRYGDITDKSSILNILKEIKNKYTNNFEIYNLCAQSHVGLSFECPDYTTQVNSNGVLNLLEAVRNLDLDKTVKIYQASTSELYGMVQEIPQKESTPFYPRSPYAISKLYAFWMIKNYRESYNIFSCNGILFNHESCRRGEQFVTRKITKGVANIIKGKSDRILLGNINSKRDWGHAKDYIEGMWLMLQQDTPNDYVLSTGQNFTIKEFIEKTFKTQNIDIVWKGEGINEIGYDLKTNIEYVFIDQSQFRPAEVDELIGDCSMAKKILGWKHNYSLDDLIKEMIDHDLKS